MDMTRQILHTLDKDETRPDADNNFRDTDETKPDPDLPNTIPTAYFGH